MASGPDGPLQCHFLFSSPDVFLLPGSIWGVGPLKCSAEVLGDGLNGPEVKGQQVIASWRGNLLIHVISKQPIREQQMSES